MRCADFRSIRNNIPPLGYPNDAHAAYGVDLRTKPEPATYFATRIAMARANSARWARRAYEPPARGNAGLIATNAYLILAMPICSFEAQPESGFRLQSGGLG